MKGEQFLRPGRERKVLGRPLQARRAAKRPIKVEAPMGTLGAAAANVQGMVRASGVPAEAIGIGGHQQEDQQRPPPAAQPCFPLAVLRRGP